MMLTQALIASAAIAIFACAGCTGPATGAAAEACVEIDRVYTPGVRPGEAGRVRVVRRSVPCRPEAQPNEPPFESEIAAARHLAREGFPVDVTLYVNPQRDTTGHDVARFVIPSEWFDPNNPPLMLEITDGQMRAHNIYTLAGLVDGEYRNRLQVSHPQVETYHQVSISGYSTEDPIATSIEALSTYLSEYYTFVRDDENGLQLFHFDSPFETKDQHWRSPPDSRESVQIVCRAVDLGGRGPPEATLEYSLCMMGFMAAPYIRVNISLMHSQVDDWRFHRDQALALVQNWRVE